MDVLQFFDVQLFVIIIARIFVVTLNIFCAKITLNFVSLLIFI